MDILEIESMASDLALDCYFSNRDYGFSYDQVIDALYENNEIAIESMGISIWEPFEHYTLDAVAELIESEKRVLVTFAREIISQHELAKG